MGENILQNFAKLNIRNLIIISIVIIWALGVTKGLWNKDELTASAQKMNEDLSTILKLILGYYLKSELTSEKTND